MAQIIKVEQSSYTQNIIDVYAANKVGQYSKYLSQTPTFVTYYAVNQIMSRTDTGTGTVRSETGYNSPLRFNKIKGLPVYNIPVLFPDIEYDETGMDLNIEINDAILLPNTVKPTVPDYMIVYIPNNIQVLFRIHTFRYNTIQSNEFVYISLEVKGISNDEESKLESQVVKTYYTVFENIGTEDNCFIEEESIADANSLADAIDECTEIYDSAFFDEMIGTYLYKDQNDSSNILTDDFLINFINNTDLFPHRVSTITTLPYMDYNPPGSEFRYKRSLLYGIENKTNKFLTRESFVYLSPTSNPMSPLEVFNYNALVCKHIICNRPNDMSKSNLYDYYDMLMKSKIVDGEKEYPSLEYIDDENMINHINKYTEDERYIMDTIIKYINSNEYSADIDKIIKVMINANLFSFFYGPVIIYILKKQYDSYFSKSTT